jgi:uncharacterized protein (DUF1499 family)
MNKQISIVLIVFIFLIGCSGTVPVLGVNNGILLACPDKPNCVSSQTSNTTQFMQAIHLKNSVKETHDKIIQIITSFNNAKIITKDTNYIRAEFTSNIFKFVDDLEFYIDSTNETKTIIHFRSASRIGHSDFDVNRKRIEEIKSMF